MAGQEWLQQRLDAICRQGLWRQQLIRFPQAAASRHGSDRSARQPIDFCSNDYLALSDDVRLVETLQEAVRQYGIGSGGSPLICGYSRAHAELEGRVCELTGYPRALLFTSGYLANLALVGTFADCRRSCVLMDKHNHASLIDAGRLAAAKLRRYPHLNLPKLDAMLTEPGRKMVITEGVFSMSGAVPDLGAIAALCKRHDALLAVDDAHGFGVLGEAGAGSIRHHRLASHDVPLMMATFGKAVGVQGAFIAGTEKLIALLLQRGRSYMYSTALPAALAATASQALDLVAKENWRREKLHELIAFFRHGAEVRGLGIVDSMTPVQGLLIKGNDDVVRAGDWLAARGMITGVIRSPTVPKNTERLRISLTAALSQADVALLLDGLAVMQERLAPP